jgi:hypothetical protein
MVTWDILLKNYILLDFTYYYNTLLNKKYKYLLNIITDKEYLFNIFFDKKENYKKYNLQNSIFNLFSNIEKNPTELNFYYDHVDIDNIHEFKNGSLLSEDDTIILRPTNINTKENIFLWSNYDIDLLNNILLLQNNNEQNSTILDNFIANDDLTLLLYDYYKNNISKYDEYKEFSNKFRLIFANYIKLFLILKEMDIKQNKNSFSL